MQIRIPGAVLAGAGVAAYSLAPVPAGTWYVQAFLDDDDSAADKKEPIAGLGDVVQGPGVGEVVVTDGVDVTHDVVLTFRIGSPPPPPT
jgi:hypothetical protein